MKKLEVLELKVYHTNSHGRDLGDLYRLENLKKFKFSGNMMYMPDNILNSLRFGVFQNLEDLEGHFFNHDLESIRNMKWITPKLKAIKLKFINSDGINVLLEALENLEHLRINWSGWDFQPKSVYPKIKRIEFFHVDFSLNFAKNLVKIFPNLEFLMIKCDEDVNMTKSMLETLLVELMQLKELKLGVYYAEIDSRFI
jgi:hypothetical protein